ncbi:2-C-methyl-D-erythritol 4-phosphate cytidylyltransferase [Propionicimonas sp.]|uniref:2-C-methyl-D-erythritol 4-phosphate cytidylyltransferase n=1 Tax=Propionicimonas sp. TaxID=1955623 RepID=UPI0039E2FDAC
MSEPVVAVVVAAGLGRRFGGTKPKPTLRILGRAVVAVAVEGLAAGGCTDAVVVINGKVSGAFKAALAGSPIPVITTPGGDTRQQSVQRGLEVVRTHPRLSKARVVLVHDAVRPMMPAYVVENVIGAVRDGAVAVTPVVPVTDSIRVVPNGDESENEPFDRSKLRAVQTPQGFDLDVLLDSHDRMARDGIEFTDDVSACEQNGHRVTLVPGSRMGMKITEPADLTIARALWRVRASLGHHSGKRFWRQWRKELGR